jgi:serine/threonine protein kinase
MVGPYVLDAPIGTGAAATGWRAWRSGAGASAPPVAIKLFHQRGDAARAEAALLGALDHPNVVRLHDVLVTRAGTALVLEHASGGSLAALLARRGPLDPGEVVSLGLGIGAALVAAHDRGIVHGDVHPGNVLLTADGRVLLADFGLAAGEGCGGAAGFTAPEVERGEAPSRRSDVWSLGAVCRAALGASELRGIAPTTLVVVLAVALAADPADRFGSAREMLDALADALPARPILTAAPQARLAPAQRAVRLAAPLLTRRFGPRPPARRQPISSKKLSRSSACSSSTAKTPSSIRRVVTSLSPSQRMISL